MKPSAAVLFLLLALAGTLTASAQLRETPVSTPTIGRAEGDQGGPLAATNGTDFFAVWNDTRGGTFGTRIAADGRVLDPTGIFITASQPRALLWCGDAYVLVYSAADNRSAGLVRINTEGKVIDGPRDVTQSYVAAAATNGSTIVLVGTNITVLDNRAQFVEQIAPPVAGGYAWAATSNGTTYELAVALYSGVNWVAAAALDGNGHAQKVLYFGGSANQVLVTPAAAGYRVFYGDRLKNTVMTFDTANDPAPVSSLPGIATTEAVTTTANGYLLATRSFSEVQLKIARGSGDTIVDPQPFVTTSAPATPATPSFASAGDNVLLVWSDQGPTGDKVRGVVLDGSGHAKSATFDLTGSAPAQVSPAIATGATNDLVAWQEKSGIYASRLAPDGMPLDGRGIQLASTGFGPRVVRDDDAYVVAWLTDRTVELRWIDASAGTSIGGTIDVDIEVTGYSLAKDDVGVVLFYTDHDGHLWAQRLGKAGLIGSAVPVITDSVPALGALATWNGHEWLVLWSVQHPLPIPIGIPLFGYTIKAERLTDSFAVIDAQPMEIVDFPVGLSAVAVATNGDDFFVAWSDNDFNAAQGVYSRTIRATGPPTGPALVIAANDTSVEAAAWDGSHYAVAYQARREDVFYAFRLMLTHAGLGDQLVISVAAPDQREVALAATPGRPLRAAYTHIATEPQYGYVTRLFTRDLVYARHRLAPH